MKQKVYYGFEKLKKIFKNEQTKNIFLVTGKNSFKKSLALDKLNEILNEKVNLTHFTSFSPNPKFKEIKNGLKIFKNGNYDLILSVGGGSAIDVAKSIKFFSKKNIPLVAIPTTAGSGSEATYFIVFYKNKKKISEGQKDFTLPNYVILDFNFLKSLPRKIMASAGIDALGQAIESYWSIHSTEKSKKYSKKSIKLIINYLTSAILKKDKKSLKKILMGSHLAGKAINITKTTSCHSIAYPLTSYFEIPHGHAVGLTLGEMLKFNFGVSKKNCLDKRGENYVKKTIFQLSKILGKNDPNEASEKIHFFLKEIGLENKLSNLGLKKKGFEDYFKERI